MATKTPSAPKTAAKLAGVTLPDDREDQVRLGSLWEDGPAVIVWLRHYGWTHCRDFAMQLHRAHEDISDAGARLVLIGQATPKHAAHFRRRFAPSVQILADEDRSTYKLAGTVRGGAAELIGPSVVLKGIGRSVKNRSAQGRPIGDVRQLGGSMIVMPDGTIPWSHLSTDAADNATVPEIIEALRDATG